MFPASVVAIEKSFAIAFLPLFRALWRAKGGRLKAGNENPAAAAACKDCNNAAECSWAFLRSSATDVVLGSELDVDKLGKVGDPEDVVRESVILAAALDIVNDEIAEAAEEVDVIEGQHVHRPGNAFE